MKTDLQNSYDSSNLMVFSGNHSHQNSTELDRTDMERSEDYNRSTVRISFTLYNPIVRKKK